MNREEKTQRVAELKERLSSSQLVVLTDFTGLDVAKMTELRSQLKGVAAEYVVAKNTLIRLAAKDTLAEKLSEHFVGPNGLAMTKDQIVGLAKVLSEFVKTNKKLNLKAGILQGRPVSPEEIKRLASLPSREELLAQLLGTLNSVPTSLVSVLAGIIRQFLGVLKAIEEQKASASA